MSCCAPLLRPMTPLELEEATDTPGAVDAAAAVPVRATMTLGSARVVVAAVLGVAAETDTERLAAAVAVLSGWSQACEGPASNAPWP